MIEQEEAMAAPRSADPLLRRVCSIIDIGTADDLISRSYDILYTLVILVNLAVTIAYTFDEAEALCGGLLLDIEAVTVAFFAVDCVLRLWTAKYHHPSMPEWKAICAYIFSFPALWIFSASCPTICRYSSPPGRWPSGCSGWCGSSGSSGSTPIMIP